METIENILQEQSGKAREKIDQTSMGVGNYLDEEIMDFKIDNFIRLDHWILWHFSSVQCQDKKSSVLDYFQYFRKDYPID